MVYLGAFLFATAAAAAAASYPTRVSFLQSQLYNGSVTAEFVSGHSSLDALKLSGTANADAYEWWYFDVASNSSNQSVTVVFYNTGSQGFPGGFIDGPLSVQLAASFKNGSTYNQYLTAPMGAVLVDDAQDGVSGRWNGTGFAFAGTSLQGDRVVYQVDIRAPELDIYGSIILYSVIISYLSMNVMISSGTTSRKR